jgi:hypothetical protein
MHCVLVTAFETAKDWNVFFHAELHTEFVKCALVLFQIATEDRPRWTRGNPEALTARVFPNYSGRENWSWNREA